MSDSASISEMFVELRAIRFLSLELRNCSLSCELFDFFRCSFGNTRAAMSGSASETLVAL